MNSEYSLFCTFAEDVRREASGQISIIGVFPGGLATPEPVRMKICIVASLFLPKEFTSPKSIVVRASWNDDTLAEAVAPDNFIEFARKAAAANVAADDPSSFGIMAQFVITTNVEVQATGRLRVKATINDNLEVRGNALKILVGQPVGSDAIIQELIRQTG